LNRLLRFPILMAACALYPLLLFVAALISEREPRTFALGSARRESVVTEDHVSDNEVASLVRRGGEDEWNGSVHAP
jgi:hypothetical protein